MPVWTDEERRAELARRQKESLDQEASWKGQAQPKANTECVICNRPFFSHDPGAQFPICETCD